MGCGFLKFIFILICCIKGSFSACVNDALDKPEQCTYLDEITHETCDKTETACKNKTSLLENVQNFTLCATWGSSSKCLDVVDKPKQHTYLDEIIKEIKNEAWDVTETACKNKILSLLENVQNFTLWATWVWDSMDIKPVGSLYGSQYQLGNYDQCLTSWTTYPELRTQYCLANIKIEKQCQERSRRGMGVYVFDPYGKADAYMQASNGFGQDLNLITWGVCVPASCDPQSVQRFVSKLLKYSHFGTSKATINIESCEEADTNQRYSIGHYLFFGFTGSIVCIATISTYIYSWMHSPKASLFYLEIIRCFSVSENFKRLTDTNDEELTVLNGIRFLTSAVVVLIHQAFIVTSTAVFNGTDIEKLLNHYTISWALRIDLVVDTFFMMSGLLLVNTCMSIKEMNVRNLGKQLLKRYFRLATTLAAILLFLNTIGHSLGSGPLLKNIMELELNSCRKNWWLSLLMLSNYIDTENLCYPVVWSINCDFHFSIVGTALVYLYNKSSRAGFLTFAATFIVALVTPGVYTALYQFPPVLMFYIKFFRQYRFDLVFNEMYLPSHNRLAAYLVGMMFGYVLYVYKPNDFKKSISRIWSIVGTSVGLGLMIGVVKIGTSYYGREYSRVEAVLYAALNRPLWAFAVGLIVLCCVYGTVPFVNGYLSWSVFRPLSRLTYGVYIAHGIFWICNFFFIRNPYYIGAVPMMTDYFGVLTISFFISLILWLFVEAPAANFVNYLLRKSEKT